MSREPPTLSVVLGLDRNPAEEHLSVIQASRCLSALQKSIRKGVPPQFWGAVAAQVIDRLREALNIPLPRILAGGWNKYRGFLQYRDRQRYPPDVISVVPLGTHTIRSTHRPSVELLVNEQTAGKIEFQVEITITLEGAVLSIGDGRFRELRTGTCKLKATLSCEGAILVDQPLQDYTLPGVLSFGDGIPIIPGRSSYP